MATATIISSQRYIDPEIVAQKIEAEDYAVQVSPVFVVDGEAFRVVTDGHHSLAAAREAGAEVEWEEQGATENDTIAMLDRGDVAGFLETHYIDSEYYDVATGELVW